MRYCSTCITKTVTATQKANVSTIEELAALAHSSTKDYTLFINIFVLFIKQGKKRGGLEPSSLNPTTKTHFSVTERQVILNAVCEAIEKRLVSLVVASRLVKRHWPRSFYDVSGRRQQQYVRNLIIVWICEELSKSTLSSPDARAILNNSCHLLRGKDVSLVGNLALRSIGDIEEVQKPDALISVLWSIHLSGAHPPKDFLRSILVRLTQLNDGMKEKITGVLADNRDSEGKLQARRSNVGHVFSGLTTRQIYRLLEVLKAEKWDGEIGPLRDLVDQALKNIVFETEAANFPTNVKMTKWVTESRIAQVADLSSEQFLRLLAISGDFEIPFSISAAHVSQFLLTPLVQFSDREKLLLLVEIARKTRCHSVALFNALIDKVVGRGLSASYALPLSKSILKTIVKDGELFPFVKLEAFIHFFLSQCEYYTVRVRAEEIVSLSEILYTLSRRFTLGSPVGQRMRRVLDCFAEQLNRLITLQAVPPDLASKVLEHTVLMGMRGDASLYPHIHALYRTRNNAANQDECWKEENDTEAAPSRKRWEDTPESKLPTVSKAALSVYKELIFMFERMDSVKASMTEADFRRFQRTIEKTGLYNILHGGQLMSEGHLVNGGENDTIRLPGWMEKELKSIVLKKIGTARLSANSTNDEILRVLGHVHCDQLKVRGVIHMVERSPFTLLRRQRAVWEYLDVLSKRFGSAEECVLVSKAVENALF